jgi:hypothetical protein
LDKYKVVDKKFNNGKGIIDVDEFLIYLMEKKRELITHYYE